MLQLPTSEYLVAQLAARGIALPPGPVGVSGFGDSAQLSAELIGLILNGSKRATSALLWSYQADGEALPRVGNLEIVVDHCNQAVCVTRVTSVTVMPFDRVDARHAALEGEGDLSLAWWRVAHDRFFTRECRRLGCTPTDDMPVVWYEFEVIVALG